MLRDRRQSVRNNKHFLSLAVASALFASNTQADVILHAFNWQYDDVANKAAEIAQSGYKKVLVSPAYKSTGDQWWARYQPQDYRVIDNPLGDTNDFSQMVAALAAQGVETYADIVFNHMANEASQRSDLNYPGSAVLGQYAANQPYYDNITLFGDVDNGLFGGGDFHGTYDPQGPQCISDYSNVGDVQYNRLCGAPPDPGLPDLDANSWVIEQQKSYLQALKSMGVSGFRVDAAKHMTNGHINQIFTPQIKNNVHVFGEIITTGGAGSAEYDNFLAPYLSQTGHSAYDFPLFSQIRSAFSYSGSMNNLVDPGAYGQALPAAKAITFSVTHDIPLNEGFRYQLLDPTDEYLANAFILGRDGGVPLMYSDHNESGDGRWENLYNRSDVTAMVGFHNATQGRSMNVLNNNDCILLFQREHQGVVGINKCGEGQDVWVDTSAAGLWWDREYRDTLSNDTQVITSQWHNFYLPPREARMWLMQ